MKTLAFEPLLPLTLWLILVAAAAALGLLYILYKPPEIPRTRRAVVTALWYLGVAGPLVLLLNPSWVIKSGGRSARPRLKVLFDTSGSMGTRDLDGRSRISTALSELKEARPGLERDFEVEYFAFDGAARSVAMSSLQEIRPSGQVTDIVGALESALAAMPQRGGAVLLVSDGADNIADGVRDFHKAASLAKALGIPVFTETFGTTSSGKDLSIELVRPRELAFVGQEARASCIVRQRGFAGATVEVQLLESGRPVETGNIVLKADSPSVVDFTVKRDTPGVFLYEIAMSASPEETTRLNNKASFVLTVVDEAIQILLLEGKPYWDTKFLVRALTRDKAVNVTSAVRLTGKRILVRRPPEGDGSAGGAEATQPVEIVSDEAAFLRDPAQLDRYQVIILGRDTGPFLTEWAVGNLKKWIAETGGTLVCSRGKPAQTIAERLDPVMPVRWAAGRQKRVRLRLTPLGESLRWFPAQPGAAEGSTAEGLPGLATGDAIISTKPLTSIVANASGAPDMPVVCYQPYGSGHTLVLEGSGAWHWTFLAPEHRPEKDPYPYFWGSLVRWMVSSAEFLPSQTAALRSAKAVFSTREKAVVFIMLKSDESEFGAANPPEIEITADGARFGELLRAAPVGREVGLFKVAAGPLPQGVYQARLARRTDGPPAECVFQVQPPLDEQCDVAARPVLMSMIAAESGGEDLGRRGLQSLQAAYADYWMRTNPPDIRRISAWDRISIMVAAISVWAVCWVVRRRGGLM